MNASTPAYQQNTPLSATAPSDAQGNNNLPLQNVEDKIVNPNPPPPPPLPAWKGGAISKYRPVSIALGAACVTVFALYKTGKLDKNKLDCSNTFGPTVARNFIHFDLLHLVFNLISLFYASSIEAQMGSIPYLALVGIIILICSLGMMAITKLFNVKCSIGASSFILALLTFGLITQKEKSFIWPLIYLVVTSVTPLAGAGVSLAGHACGIATGALLGVTYRAATGWNSPPPAKTGKQFAGFSIPGL